MQNAGAVQREGDIGEGYSTQLRSAACNVEQSVGFNSMCEDSMLDSSLTAFDGISVRRRVVSDRVKTGESNVRLFCKMGTSQEFHCMDVAGVRESGGGDRARQPSHTWLFLLRVEMEEWLFLLRVEMEECSLQENR